MLSETKHRYKSLDGTEICGILRRAEDPIGTVILAHGFDADKNEFNNFYVDIADKLEKNQLNSFRFDFRGHGESEGSQQDVTIMGELLDLKASVIEVMDIVSDTETVFVLGTSFGAGPAIFYSSLHSEQVDSLVLLSPLLDYSSTLSKLEYDTDDLREFGFMTRDSGFKMSGMTIEEMRLLRPYRRLSELNIPVLTMHGDTDEIVPYEPAQEYGDPNTHSEFVLVEDVGHGFFAPGDETGEDQLTQSAHDMVFEKFTNWFKKHV